jgi:hypothetical protein
MGAKLSGSNWPKAERSVWGEQSVEAEISVNVYVIQQMLPEEYVHWGDVGA